MSGRMAVLRDFPLRIWQRQQEHVETLLREFQLIAAGGSTAPQELLSLASYVTTAHGATVDRLAEERHAALAQGLDRMDSQVPLLDELPQLLDQVEAVLARADDYCRATQLLLLPRSPELLTFAEWTSAELRRQYAGKAPTPWPGPF